MNSAGFFMYKQGVDGVELGFALGALAELELVAFFWGQFLVLFLGEHFPLRIKFRAASAFEPIRNSFK